MYCGGLSNSKELMEVLCLTGQLKMFNSFLTPAVVGSEYVFPSGDFGRCALAGTDSLLDVTMAIVALSIPPNMWCHSEF